jgi:hypothetical protein
MLKLRIERTGTVVPVQSRSVDPRFEVWRDIQGEISAYSEIRDEHFWMHLPGLASFRFTCCGDEIAAAVTNTVAEERVRDAYRRKVLPMALQVCGREVLHASAVRSAAGVIALCGISETGKSTIAFGLSRRGYPLWADDAVVFEISERGGLAISLPFDMRLEPSAAEAFDLDGTRVSESAGEDDPAPGAQTAPLVAVCVLRRTDSAAPNLSIRRLSSSEAFSAVLDHSCCFSPLGGERKRRMINNYLELAARVPIVQVSFKPGFENLPAILDGIERVLDEHNRQT